VRLLLDTHTLVWSLTATPRLPVRVRNALSAPTSEIFVSVASVWEIAIKVGLGKWPAAEPLLADIETRLANMPTVLLPISVAHVRHAGLLQSTHRDPFDRLLAAQAQIEGLTLVTADAKLATLGALVLW
jgi:PIN domain nuclease of toxin-antitoxin system